MRLPAGFRMFGVRRGTASSLLLLCSAVGVCQTAPPAAPYRVTGVLVNSVTGAPVRHGRIAASRIESPAPNQRRYVGQGGVETDASGHFALSLPSAGAWSIRASAPGYPGQAFDQHEGFSSAVVLTEKQPTYDLHFTLAPECAITGNILDEGNEPVRQAQIQVFFVPKAGADGAQAPRNRGFATTDDRGHYEVSGLVAGDYRISVQARPWYATSVARSGGIAGAVQLEPSLDVVYPTTWYPGSQEQSGAQTLTLHEGETAQADLQLRPIPAIHLRIPMPVEEPSNNGQRRYPQISAISGNRFASMSFSTNAQGQIEYDGLSPGLYRVQTPDENGQMTGRSTILEVGPNSAQTLDLATAATTATVTVKIDGGPGTESVPLAFADATNEGNVFRSSPERGGARGRRPAGSNPAPGRTAPSDQAAPSDPSIRVIDLPPGRYAVFQGGSANYFVAGLAQGQKEIAGRMVTIPAGASNLTVHIAEGRATVTGIATLDGKAAVGAMVLLVPTTVGQAGGIAEVRRDQTNTDGSFDLNQVIPGEYILVAIDHGWGIAWDDPETLSKYLLKGVPLDLRKPYPVKQDVEVQLP